MDPCRPGSGAFWLHRIQHTPNDPSFFRNTHGSISVLVTPFGSPSSKAAFANRMPVLLRSG